jgi:hypothetical protein
MIKAAYNKSLLPIASGGAIAPSATAEFKRYEP